MAMAIDWWKKDLKCDKQGKMSYGWHNAIKWNRRSHKEKYNLAKKKKRDKQKKINDNKKIFKEL